MEKAEKYDKIVNEMRELLNEKKMLEEIKNQKKLLKEKERLKEIKEREFLKGLKFRKNKGYFEKVEFDIPDFIRDMDCNDVLSIKANKEYFKKFKNFALYNNINIGRLVNYLFYYAMEELGKKK